MSSLPRNRPCLQTKLLFVPLLQRTFPYRLGRWIEYAYSPRSGDAIEAHQRRNARWISDSLLGRRPRAWRRRVHASLCPAQRVFDCGWRSPLSSHADSARMESCPIISHRDAHWTQAAGSLRAHSCVSEFCAFEGRRPSDCRPSCPLRRVFRDELPSKRRRRRRRRH